MDNMPTQDEVNEYLDDLRESGITNMYGAAPFVAEAFGISKDVARTMLQTWMQNFGQRVK